GEKAVFAPGDAREDWSILRALSDVMGATLPFDSFEQLRAEMAKAVPALGQEGLVDFDWSVPSLPSGATGELGSPIKDFYLTNAICRASPTMQQCSAELIHGESFAEAAE
ncbi:MAG TPA: NADH-quinone oxidoreductase subunit G, partial [Sphingobium sp.]|nr:NADH-quinone oxidoreductase subunit G [Sphingobium sp.]